MGLWTVYGIVKEHEGQVCITSKPNEGTTVEIAFPVSEKAPEVMEFKKPDRLSDPGSSIRLLIVDDEPVITSGLKNLFNLAKYNAIGFTNGLNALKKFVEDPNAIDIVITDQIMPHISGEELIRELKAIRPGIPVILCSGYSEVLVRKDSGEIQADAYCEKPIQFDEIVAIVEQLAGKEA